MKAALTALALAGACVPAPPFHGDSPDAPPAPPGNVNVTVVSRDGHATPSPAARVLVTSPDGTSAIATTNAFGAATLPAAANATLYVEDPNNAGDPLLFVLLGVQPGDQLHVGREQTATTSTHAIQVSATTHDATDVIELYARCGTTATGSLGGQVVTPLNLDDTCTQPYDLVMLQRATAGMPPTWTGRVTVAPGDPTASLDPVAAPPTLLQLAFGNADKLSTIGGSAWMLDADRRVVPFPYLTASNGAPSVLVNVLHQRTLATTYELESELYATDAERGIQVVRQRRPYPPADGIDLQDAGLAPWTNSSTLAPGNTVAWTEVTTAPFTFALADISFTDAEGTARAIRVIAPREALADTADGHALAIPLPPTFAAYGLDAATMPHVGVRLYRFAAGVTYDTVRGAADPNARPDNDFMAIPGVSYVAISGVQPVDN